MHGLNGNDEWLLQAVHHPGRKMTGRLEKGRSGVEAQR